MKFTNYHHKDTLLHYIELKNASSSTQEEVMETWFHENFKNPAKNTPDSESELCDAKRELLSEFEIVIPKNIIEKFAQKLSAECQKWDRSPIDFYKNDLSVDDPYEGFINDIDDINMLLNITDINININIKEKKYLHKLLYANIITVIETYLSYTFIGMIYNHKDLIRKFIENTPKIEDRKILIAGICKIMESIESRSCEKVIIADAYKIIKNIESKAGDYCRSFVWHRMDDVAKMYEDVLSVKFPNTGEIKNAVKKRHDIVHRNGKNRTSHDIDITQEHISSLIATVREFVNNIEMQIQKLHLKKLFLWLRRNNYTKKERRDIIEMARVFGVSWKRE